MAEAAEKEPSMEDILSSIRKIIADDGASSKPKAPNPLQEHQAEAAKASQSQPERPMQAQSQAESPASPYNSAPSQTVREAAKEMAATDTAPSMPAPAAIKSEPDDGSPSGANAAKLAGSLANIAESAKSKAAEDKFNQPNEMPKPAPLRSEAGLSRSEPEVKAPYEAPREPEAPVFAEPTVTAMPRETASTPRQAAMPEASAPPPSAIQAAPIAEPKPAPVVEPVAISTPSPISQPAPEQAPRLKEETPVLESAVESDEIEAFKGALMSPSADSAVSGAFERLRRSMMDDVDAKTESILRPMLREWLDDNLPTLVERLVREEIERVARGS